MNQNVQALLPPCELKPASRNKRLRSSSTAVLQPPYPLYSKEYGICILYSAKSASVYTLEWFLLQTGRKDIVDRSGWLHDFRTNELEKNPSYIDDLVHVKEENPTIIRVVRDPFARAVSSYLHAIKHLERRHDLPGELTAFTQKPMTFRNFIHTLEDADIRHVNQHWATQTKDVERSGYLRHQYLVKTETITSDFYGVEVLLNLPHKPVQKAMWVKHRIRYDFDERETKCADTAFTVSMACENPPWYTCFYDAELEAKVRSLYAEDFERFEYATSLAESDALHSRPVYTAVLPTS